MRRENNRVIVSIPTYIQDAAQWVSFPTNYLLSLLFHIQPQESVWNEDDFETQDVSGTGIGLDKLKHHILTDDDYTYTEADIVRLFDTLPTAGAEKDLIGRVWEGKILRTSSSVLDFAYYAIHKPLKKLGFQWGKRYSTANKGDPLFLRWRDRFYIPVPFWGNVSMIDIKWRGKTTATMSYDHQPWRDYFRILSNQDGKVVLLGVWTHKHIAGGWFTLTLDNDVTANG